jgi:hypothetical protein
MKRETMSYAAIVATSSTISRTPRRARTPSKTLAGILTSRVIESVSASTACWVAVKHWSGGIY